LGPEPNYAMDDAMAANWGRTQRQDRSSLVGRWSPEFGNIERVSGH